LPIICQFPLDEKLSNENQDSSKADIRIKNATNLRHYAETNDPPKFIKKQNNRVAQTVFCF
jgi:hypothetical protein